jgi:hypothetical protein
MSSVFNLNLPSRTHTDQVSSRVTTDTTRPPTHSLPPSSRPSAAPSFRRASGTTTPPVAGAAGPPPPPSHAKALSSALVGVKSFPAAGRRPVKPTHSRYDQPLASDNVDAVMLDPVASDRSDDLQLMDISEETDERLLGLSSLTFQELFPSGKTWDGQELGLDAADTTLSLLDCRHELTALQAELQRHRLIEKHAPRPPPAPMPPTGPLPPVRPPWVSSTSSKTPHDKLGTTSASRPSSLTVSPATSLPATPSEKSSSRPSSLTTSPESSRPSSGAVSPTDDLPSDSSDALRSRRITACRLRMAQLHQCMRIWLHGYHAFVALAPPAIVDALIAAPAVLPSSDPTNTTNTSLLSPREAAARLADEVLRKADAAEQRRIELLRFHTERARIMARQTAASADIARRRADPSWFPTFSRGSSVFSSFRNA